MRRVPAALLPHERGTRFAERITPLWRWLALGLILRIALSPLQHTWDSQTWWNVASELGREPNLLNAVAAPYEHMRQLSALAHGSGFSSYYEYWAYPPGMLLLWWPVARAWFVLAGPLAERFAGPDTFTAMPIPFFLSLGMKAPIILADLVTAVLLGRLANASAAKWYLLNPYVLLVGAWTFDPVMVALLLAAILAAQNQRWALAGTLLGLGAAIKFVPALLVPVVMLYAWRVPNWSSLRSSVSRAGAGPVSSLRGAILAGAGPGSPLRAAALAGACSVAVFGAVCAPWRDGVLYVLQFHAARVGGGMSWQAVWSAFTWIDTFADLSAVRLFLSAQIGTLTLTGCLLIAFWLAWLRGLDLLRTSLVVLLAYLAGSKLVNEAYPLAALALALAVIATRCGPSASKFPANGDGSLASVRASSTNGAGSIRSAWASSASGDGSLPSVPSSSATGDGSSTSPAQPTSALGESPLVRFLWVTPLVFAALNVPAWGFGLAPAESLGLIDLETARLYHAGYILTYQYLSILLAIIGTGFQIGCALAAWQLLRPIRRTELVKALGVAV